MFTWNHKNTGKPTNKQKEREKEKKQNSYYLSILPHKEATVKYCCIFIHTVVAWMGTHPPPQKICRCNYIKDFKVILDYLAGPNAHGESSYKEKKIHRQRKSHAVREAELLQMRPQAKESLRPPESRASRGSPGVQTSGVRNYERINSVVLSCQVCGILRQQPQEAGTIHLFSKYL